MFKTFFAILLPLIQAPTQQPNLELTTVRFYRTGTTLVDGFCRVPFALLQPLGAPAGGASYRIQVTVRDSSGLVLTDQSWSQQVRQDVLGVSGASAVEHFAFAAERGRYQVEIAVTDSASQRKTLSTTTVEPFTSAPGASDLLLSTSLQRRATPEAAQPGVIEKGPFLLAATTRPVLTPQSGKLFFYLELYPGREARGTLDASVRTPDGRTLTTATPEQVSVAGAGGIAAHGLDLTGLPPGSYQLVTTIHLADTVLTRTADFGVSGFQVASEVKDLGTSQDLYSSLGQPALDSLYLPLVHIMEESERGVYEGLTLEGKRNFLRQFWNRRDPTPGTPVNEFRERYYKGIEEANRRFRESGTAAVPGWRTDRGRILIRYGEPDEKLSRPQAGETRPYEVWKYTRGRPRKFVFMDETGFGHYVLLYSDERREPSRPDWQSVLGHDATQDIQRF